MYFRFLALASAALFLVNSAVRAAPNVLFIVSEEEGRSRCGSKKGPAGMKLLLPPPPEASRCAVKGRPRPFARVAHA